eukprot:CAMPEP_0181183040 /NCGR_PEP_ID=MMETSP1096-20121128/8210_1 /TAXON_ID=156174 ORGANISM="Chrysochromulina ericina, Strain CCMP281" /NCGR_SAMPLE_ID=MMETSP1096 /ASSEMBLY_ACC=CAM_ASM_000453 /LENGTH=74 /DNA_ID=CAMNT_0023271687 /DNA_START=67 /DNA_END=291 /DNA_ORIENTATION=-
MSALLCWGEHNHAHASVPRPQMMSCEQAGGCHGYERSLPTWYCGIAAPAQRNRQLDADADQLDADADQLTRSGS